MPATPTEPGEIIDVRPLGIGLGDAKTSVLVETESLKMIRMVMPAGKVLSEHKAPGVITVQCLEGKIAFTTMGKTVELEAGQVLYLLPGGLHSVDAIEDSSFLLTIFKTA